MSDPKDLAASPHQNALNSDDIAGFKARTLELGEKLKEAQSKEISEEEEREDRAHRMQGMALGIRLSSEMIAALIVGTLMGYGLDYVCNSKPWFFIIFLLLGFITGVFNVIRGFEQIQTQINVRKNLDKNSLLSKQTQMKS